MNKVSKFFIGIANWVMFSYCVIPAFGGKSPEVILKVIEKFISLESPFYADTRYLGRDVKKSSKLLKFLINYYIETKSAITLNQILEVLKKEFIEREKYGRK